MDLITVLKTENVSLFIDIIQLLVLAEFVIILGVIGILLLVRLHITKKQKNSIIRQEQFSQQLACFSSGKMHLTPQLIRLYQKYIFDFIECFKIVHDNHLLSDDLRREFALSILIPKAKQLSQSHRWINQRIALACYQYAGNDIHDEEILIKLVQSKVLIVCISAGRIIFQNPKQRTMQSLITMLSSSRKLYQDLFLQILPSVENINKAQLTDYFVDRLEKDHNVYVRCFCYRLAKNLVPVEALFKSIQADILSKNLELTIAALNYLSCIPNQESLQIIESATLDVRLEVRAVAVKLLGECKAFAAISLLESKLRDCAWWVRINAANALMALGVSGIEVLRRQNPEVDTFAYETSQKVLLTLGESNEFGQNN
ncbi:hypothetical protein N9Q05_01260 [bacterium]|nr:hypothetical protein [bacterium]